MSSVAAGAFSGLISRGEDAIDYKLAYRGLQGTVQQAHIHLAQPRMNGGIVVWLTGRYKCRGAVEK